MNNRVAWVDCARGIGILLVVYGHVARGIMAAGLMDERGAFQTLDSVIYSFHMPLFFFLSGMFFLNSYRKKGIRLITGKVAVLVYPYLIWSIIQTGVKILMGGHTNHPAQFIDFITLLWLPVEQFWFLYSLFLLFVLEILCFSALRKAGLSEQACVILTGAVSLGLFLMRPLLPGVFQIQTVAGYMVYFHGGVSLSFFSKDKIRLLRTPLPWFMLFAFGTAVNLLWLQGAPVLPLIPAFSGSMFVIALSNVLRPPGVNAFSSLGKFSMEIYLAHILFASGFRIVLLNIFEISSLSLHVAGGLVFGLLGPVIFAKICKKHPFGSLFFRPHLRGGAQ